MGLAQLFRRKNVRRDAATSLYASIITQARSPAFYLQYGVPDTVDGRFDLIVIHAMLVMRRLRDGGQDALEVGQILFDIMFIDMDQSLREMGVGDMGIRRHIKKMGQAFYGRAATYEAAMATGDEALKRVLTENIYRLTTPTPEQVGALAQYLPRAAAHMATQDVAEIVAGRVTFAPAVVESAHVPSESRG